MFFKTLFINLILVILILFGTWYTWQQLARSNNSRVAQHQADAYAINVIIFHTDIEGNIYDQVRTPLLVHYPADDSILLSSPVFDLFLKNNESWELSANYGKLKENYDLLQLWGKVTLNQKKMAHALPSTTLTTSVLTVNFKERTADTSAPVTIVQPNQVIHAMGLHADFASKTIQLLAQVKGQLKPTKK
jgi:LPS export ABC transporter protein LptC